jgi:uncharacterized protein (DUF305 family)
VGFREIYTTAGDASQLKAMQQAMVKAQSQEIEQMTEWYRRWFGTT